MSPRKPPRLLLSDLTNILATAAFDGLPRNTIVTADETAGRVTVALGSTRKVYQRFHVFIVEEP